MAEALPPLIPPGEYGAVVTAIKKVFRFGRAMVEFSFRIVTFGPSFNTQLKGYCTVPTMKIKNVPIPGGSKLARWMRTVAAFTGCRPTRMSLGEFRWYWYTVTVATVTRNHRQQPLRLTDQYSSVVDVVGVIGKLAELPSERPPQEGDES